MQRSAISAGVLSAARSLKKIGVKLKRQTVTTGIAVKTAGFA